MQVDGKVGRNDVKLFPIMVTEDIRVTDTLFAQFGDKDGLGVIESLPITAILAEAEVNLLSHRGFFTIEGHEQKSSVRPMQQDWGAQED